LLALLGIHHILHVGRIRVKFMKITVFWVATSKVSVVMFQSFGENSSLHLQQVNDKLQAQVLRNVGTYVPVIRTYYMEQSPS
jgi:hypothetical protein